MSGRKKPVCEECGNAGDAGALFITVDARYMPATNSWRLERREDEGGGSLDCLSCDHRTVEDDFQFFPYDLEIPA